MGANSSLINGQVTIWQYVKDLPKAVEWYEQYLGCKLILPTTRVARLQLVIEEQVGNH